ncbi:4-N-acetylgalactosaminyltransferase 3 [Striga asiatica]|uniref:4-N-acetylgalactosaminyltransferase 3 n=1 Tax=Striga asiatica TaxID=4170 RepID=A0A5A7NXQ2_STRAF|nr:4-N-acetylgalactosaminyltransferase 3 [Striga asiatica]
MLQGLDSRATNLANGVTLDSFERKLVLRADIFKPTSPNEVLDFVFNLHLFVPCGPIRAIRLHTFFSVCLSEGKIGMGQRLVVPANQGSDQIELDTCQNEDEKLRACQRQIICFEECVVDRHRV